MLVHMLILQKQLIYCSKLKNIKLILIFEKMISNQSMFASDRTTVKPV